METAPYAPRDGLAGSWGESELLSRGHVVSLDLATQPHADGGDVLETGPIRGPNAERVAVDADLRKASDAGSELAKLGTGEDGEDAIESAAQRELEDPYGLLLVGAERADLGQPGLLGTADVVRGDQGISVLYVALPPVAGTQGGDHADGLSFADLVAVGQVDGDGVGHGVPSVAVGEFGEGRELMDRLDVLDVGSGHGWLPVGVCTVASGSPEAP